MLATHQCCPQPSIICRFAALKCKEASVRRDILELQRLLGEASDEELKEFLDSLRHLARHEKHSDQNTMALTNALGECRLSSNADTDSASDELSTAGNTGPTRPQEVCTDNCMNQHRETAIERQNETPCKGPVAQEETCADSKKAPRVVALTHQTLVMSSNGRFNVLPETTRMLVTVLFDQATKQLCLHVVTGREINNTSFPHHSVGHAEVVTQIYASIYFKIIGGSQSWIAVEDGVEVPGLFHSIKCCRPNSTHGKFVYKLGSEFDFESGVLKATLLIYNPHQQEQTLGQVPIAVGRECSAVQPAIKALKSGKPADSQS